MAQNARVGGVPPVRLEAVADKLPADFETMRAEARAERYAFLERLANDWVSGPMLFDRPGEALLAVSSGVRPCRSDDLDQAGASLTTPRLLQKSEPLSASLNPLETPHIAAAALLAANSLRFLPRSDGKPIRCGTNLRANQTVFLALHH